MSISTSMSSGTGRLALLPEAVIRFKFDSLVEDLLERPAYFPLARRAYELWADLGRATNQRLLVETGGIMIGPPDSDVIRISLESAKVHGLTHEVLDSLEIRRRFPVFNPADHMIGIYQRRAGVVFPEKCILAHLHQAAAAGADLHHGEKVLRWRARANRVDVETARGRYEAGHLVVTAGPWAPIVLADLGLPLVIERQVMAWFHPVALHEAFAASRCHTLYRPRRAYSPRMEGGRFPDSVVRGWP